MRLQADNRCYFFYNSLQAVCHFNLSKIKIDRFLLKKTPKAKLFLDHA